MIVVYPVSACIHLHYLAHSNNQTTSALPCGPPPSATRYTNRPSFIPSSPGRRSYRRIKDRLMNQWRTDWSALVWDFVRQRVADIYRSLYVRGAQHLATVAFVVAKLTASPLCNRVISSDLFRCGRRKFPLHCFPIQPGFTC